MKPIYFLLFVFVGVSFAFVGKDVKIDLEFVPELVIDAAEKAVKGIKIKEAEYFYNKDGQKIYELDGKKGSKEYEIHVNVHGKVLKVEREKK